MHPDLDPLFAGRHPAALAVVALAGIFALGWLDRATGFELSFSIFYLAPIALVAWYAGGHWTALVCVASAAMWLYSDLASGHVYSHRAIPVWNAFVRLGFFSISAGLLVTLRRHLRYEELLARRDALTGLLNARAFKEAARHELARAGRWRSATSTSTTSSSSTTGTATPRGIARWSKSPPFSLRGCAGPISPDAWAATSSRFSSPTPTRRAPKRSSTSSPKRCANVSRSRAGRSASAPVWRCSRTRRSRSTRRCVPRTA
jgi:hypothetical protein